MEFLDKLKSIEENNCWDEFNEVFSVKEFPREQNGKKNRRILAKLGAILPQKTLPSKTRATIIKSFAFSCSRDTQYYHRPCKKNYACIAAEGFDSDYPDGCFPFDEVTRWILDNASTILETSSTIEFDVLKESLSFLCNVFAHDDDLLDESYRERAISLVGNLLGMDCKENDQILTRICCLAHNVINIWFRHFDDRHLVKILEGLLKADEHGVKAARDSVVILLKKDALIISYEKLGLDYRLYLLELVCKLVKKELDIEDFVLPEDSVLFLIKRFKERSNLILKTEDSYVKEQMKEPAEVIILLDLLGTLSCEMEIVKQDASLLINAVFLLKAIHMAGKSSDNNFTPLQKLTQISSRKDKVDGDSIENHVAFGFKSSLIRLIANLVYRNERNQNTVQELDGISLILDCCNIDARNPLIMQWCILAIRNLLENNPANQEFVSSSQKIRFIDTAVIREMGITLHQDGNPIGIVPLPD